MLNPKYALPLAGAVGIGLIASSADSEAVALACDTTGDVLYVPALMGLGTPHWDFGARGTFVGITRGTTRAELVRAVLEGVAHRGADLVEAAEADGTAIESLRVDGGMTANAVFVQALADAVGRPVEISPVLEATTLGAAYLAGMAVGMWSDEADVAAAWGPSRVVGSATPTSNAGARPSTGPTSSLPSSRTTSTTRSCASRRLGRSSR